MSRIIMHRGKTWTAEANSSIIGDGVTRTKVEFARTDTGETARGWVQGSMRDFEAIPLHALAASLEAALQPKKIMRDWD